MTDALGFLDRSDPDADGPLAAEDVLSYQQSRVHERFREGFATPIEAFLWMHSAGAVALGYIDEDWYRETVTLPNWWEFSALVADPAVREHMSDRPPGERSAQAVRNEYIENVLLPAFDRAMGVIAGSTDEYLDGDQGGAAVETDRQRYLAMRPRVHQRTVRQHRALRRAFGELGGLESREDVDRWAMEVSQSAGGGIGENWIDKVTTPSGAWQTELRSEGPSALLLLWLSSEVLPPMMVALRSAAKRSSETPQEPRGRMEGTPG